MGCNPIAVADHNHWRVDISGDDGPFDVGSAARIKQPGLPESTWRVTDLREGEWFTWETRIRGVHMSATHEVVANQSGTTSILRLEVAGSLAKLLWPIIRASATKNLELENAGLKTRCEQEHSASL